MGAIDFTAEPSARPIPRIVASLAGNVYVARLHPRIEDHRGYPARLRNRALGARARRGYARGSRQRLQRILERFAARG